MRIGRKPLAADFLTEVDELFLAQASFEEGARIDSGRRVPLEIDEIAAMRLIRGAPEMHEAGVVERRRRLEAGDMAAELRRLLVGAQHDRRRVPAHEAADGPFELAHARMRRLIVGVDRVDIGGVGRERQAGALAAGRDDDGVEQARRRAPVLRKPRPSRAHRAILASPPRRPSGRRSWSLPHAFACRLLRPSHTASLSRPPSIGNADAGGSFMQNSHDQTRQSGASLYQRRSLSGKYPPAKPGALECEPLKAVGGVADAAP